MNPNPTFHSIKSFKSLCQLVSDAVGLFLKVRTGARLLLAVAFAGLVSFILPMNTSGANVTWGVPTLISGDTDVNTNGTPLYAYFLGSANQTVNGATFTASSGSAVWGSVSFASFTGTFTGFATNAYINPSIAYSNVINGGVYGSATAGTVTLNGLTPGEAYSVQIWVNDSRTAGSGRTEIATNAVTSTATLDYNNNDAVGGVGQYVIGTFVATSTTNSFNLIPSASGSVQLNAICVRDLGGSLKTWLGSSGSSWGAIGNWSPSGAPIATQSVIYNNFSTANFSSVLDQNYVLTTLALSNAPAAITIGPSSGNTLTISSGISLVGISQNLTINDAFVLSASQTWNVTNNGILSVNGGVSGSAALTVVGNGTVSLGASATYTGNTTISGGALALTGSGSLSSTKIIMAGGAAFDVSALGAFSWSGKTLTNASAGAIINGTSDYTSGTISMLYDGVNSPLVQTNGIMTLSSGTVIIVNNPGAVLQTGNHTIIAAATSGNVGSVTFSDSLPAVTLNGNGAVGPISLAINGSGGLDLVVGAADVWTGASDNSWANAGNWYSASVPNPGDPVLFNNLSTANLSTVLNGDNFVSGVTVVNPSSSVMIGGANTLGISANGINLSSASQDLTIAAPVQLLATQSWIVTNSRTLTIIGALSGSSSGNVTLTGGGKVKMGANDALTGLTNVASGSGDFTNNSTLDMNGTVQAINGLRGSGVVDNSAAGVANLTVSGNGDNSSFSGIIQNTGGALGLQVNGGTLTLNSSNSTYSGGTTFNSGATLGSTASYSLGTGPVTFNPGSKAYTFACTFTNSLFLDSCYLRLGGNNFNQVWSGPITITNGLLMSGDTANDQLFLSGPINIGTGGISVTNSGNSGQAQGGLGDVLSGSISGSGGITYYVNGGNSRLTVQGANTYSGGTIVNGTSNGKLNVYGGINPFSTGTVTLNAGAMIVAYPSSVTVTNALTLNGGILESESQFNNYNTLTWAGPITLTADSRLIQFGQGALNNNQSSGVNVSGSLNMNGFTLTCSCSVDCYNGNIISGSISGAGTILYNGFANNTLTISGSNTFSGTIRSAVAGRLSIANVYALQNATLDMNAADTGTVSISGSAVIGALTGSRNLNLGSGNVSIGNNNVSTTFSGVLTNTGSLIKIGSGTLTLSANSYNGNTTVSNGTLSIQQPTLGASSTVSVLGGAFLDLNFDATNVVAGLVLNGVNQPNGIYKSGNSGGRITGIGAVQVINNTFVWSGASGTSWTTAGDWLTGVIPSGTNAVLFNASSTANLATVLNADFSIQSLIVSNPAAPVSIGGANTLTLTNGINMAGASQPLSVTAPVSLGAIQTWTVTNSLLTVSNLSGGAALTLAGGGNVVFSGTNTCTTNNTIIRDGTTLRFAGPSSSSLPTNGTIYVQNNVGANGVGTINLAGVTQTSKAYLSFAYSTALTLTNGTLIDNAAPTVSPDSHEDYNFMGTVNLATNGNYISNRRFMIGLNSVWQNGFSFTINGVGTNGSLTWGGDNNGSMNYVGVTAGDAPTLNINGGTVNFTNSTVGTGNGWLNVGCNSATSKGTININGANLNVGTWMKLGGNYNTYAGQSGTAILTVTNATVSIGGGNAGTNGVLFMDGGNGDATANTGISTLTLNNGSSLNVAQIQAGNNGTKTININGGTIIARLGATNLFMPAATGLAVNLQSGGATINSGTNNILIGSVLGSTGGLTKTGSGTLTLTNVNTYSGGTTISAGTLLASGTNVTGTGAVNINSGGTLGGAGTTASLVTNNAGGVLMPGVAGSGTLILTNSLTLLSGSTNTFVVNGSTSTASNSVALGAAVTYGGVLNIVSNGTFTVGQTFRLFSGAGATNTSSFASIAGSPGAGKAFSFTNGLLSVVTLTTGPTLTSVTPNPLTGSGYGATLNLTGSAFTGATAVLLTNLTAAVGVSYTPTVNSDTSISVRFVPGTTASSWNATVVNGTPSSQVGFTVTAPTMVNINSGNLNAAGAGKLVLSGTGGVAGNSYLVQSATNLSSPVIWTPVVTNVYGSGGSFSYTNTVSTGTPSLFLRIAQ